jgi:signal transduction histidine kinase
MRFKWWQLALVVAVAVGFMIALFIVAEIGRMRLVKAENDVRHAQSQLTRVVDMYALLMNAESGYWAYLLTGDAFYLQPLHRADGRVQLLGSELAARYRGKDERVGGAIRQLGTAAGERMDQMEKSVAVYNLEGPVAGLKLANAASRHATMTTFRELAGITRDYERALMNRSLANLERELAISGRLNLATLLVGLLLAALASIALIRNVRQRAEAAAELERQHEELKAQYGAQARELTDLARHLQHVQEEERARLSRGLHDELGGILLAARMDVTWMERHGPGEDASVRQRLARLRNVLDQGIELKRRVVEELRPTLLDTMGLLAALRWQSEETCKRANLRCTERYPEVEPRLNRAGAIALFRVVQEALANVAKHAKASNVDITFEISNQEVILTVHDDGVGAAPMEMTRPRSHGIAGMRHRINVLGGRLDVSSGPDRGTTVQVRVPLQNVTEAVGSDADDSGTFAAVPSAAGAGSAA